MPPRAIETRYKGYRFRSRLEARWAVLLDTLGLKWEYEPEGFELPSGRYLPDFKVAPCTWLEVKGDEPSATEVRKLVDLCEATECCGLVVWGLVGSGLYKYVHKEGAVVDGNDGRVTLGNSVNEYLDVCWREFEQACRAARAARFEHGENGTRR